MSSAAESNDSVPLYTLLSVCLTLSFEACHIIRSILATGDLKAKDKDASASSPTAVAEFTDPQTAADLESQLLISQNLRHVFGPSLRVVGEESSADLQLHQSSNGSKDRVLSVFRSKGGEVSADHSGHSLIDALPASFLSHLRTAHYPSSSITVWVDPLDGTKEFTLGLYSSVTVLIGVSVDGKAVAGVVAVPMKEADGKDVYIGVNGVGSFAFQKDPSVGVSDSKEGTAAFGGAAFRWTPLSASAVNDTIDRTDPNRRVLATSRSHFSPHIADLLGSLKSTNVIRNGGAGSKTIMVIEGVADAYVFPSLGTKKWDTCACEAIVGGMGGTLTDCFGHLVGYDRNLMDFMNYNGVVCSLRRHESFLFPKDVKLEDGKKKEKDASAGTNKL